MQPTTKIRRMRRETRDGTRTPRARERSRQRRAERVIVPTPPRVDSVHGQHCSCHTCANVARRMLEFFEQDCLADGDPAGARNYARLLGRQ